MSFNQHFMQKFFKKNSKITRNGFLLSMTFPKITHDSLAWSKSESIYRIRFNTPKIKKEDFTFTQNQNLEDLLQSKTKAQFIHSAFEGDYKIATDGLYTNNLEGIKVIYQRYPEIINTIQTKAQYDLSMNLTKKLIEEE